MQLSQKKFKKASTLREMKDRIAKAATPQAQSQKVAKKESF